MLGTGGAASSFAGEVIPASSSGGEPPVSDVVAAALQLIEQIGLEEPPPPGEDDRPEVVSGAPAMANPYHAKGGAPAIANLCSLEAQRKIGNAIAMVAHAIGEGAKDLSEGTSYEPKPPMLELDTQWANVFPETLHIGSGTAPGGHPQI